MYTVYCKNCGKPYESKVNRSGICPACKVNVRGKTNTRYREKTYDRITVYVPKGTREELKQYVAEQGMSINEFINNAMQMYIMELEKKREQAKEASDKEGSV